MPRYYVDLDNNRLLTGPSSTQLAATPRLWQGDKPVIEVELLTREDGVLGHYTSTASAINVRVGTLGGTAVASALTLSTVTLSAQATATAGITAAVTATGTASLLGSITATATAGVNSPTVITITPSVTTFASGRVTAYLGPTAVPPVVKYSLTPAFDKYLTVDDAGTPYDANASLSATIVSTSQTFRNMINLGVNGVWVTSPSTTHVMIYRIPAVTGGYTDQNAGILSNGWDAINSTVCSPTVTGNVLSVSQSSGASFQFLTPDGAWIPPSSVTTLSTINLKSSYHSIVSWPAGYSAAYYTNAQPVTSTSAPNGYLYGGVILTSSVISQGLNNTYSGLKIVNNFTITSVGCFLSPVYVESTGSGKGLPIFYGSEEDAKNYVLDQPQIGNEFWSTYGGGFSFNGSRELRFEVDSLAGLIGLTGPDYTDASTSKIGNNYASWVAGVSASTYTGETVSLTTETLANGKKRVTGGEISIDNYNHRPLEAAAKTGLVSLYPDRAYPGRRVERFDITDCGAQYATAPQIIISEPEDENGEIATATATIQSGKLTGLTLTNPGSGYNALPDVFVLPPTTNMQAAAARTVTSVVSSGSRTLVLNLGSGTTISENSWALLTNLGKASGLAYVVSVLTAGSQTTLKFPFNTGTIATTGAATLTPLIPYVRVTGATISGTDASFAPGSTVPVIFSTPSCGDTDGTANFTVLNSGQLSLSSIPTPGYATAFSVATLSAYRKVTGITVTCAGAGYWTTLPAITIDNAAYVATAPGATPAVVTASLNGNGSISLTIVSAGYGYTSAPTITIAAPNQGDGVRVVTLVTRGVGYGDGTFACTVSAPPAGGAQAVVNFVKSGTSQGFVVVNAGRGYLTAPAVTVAAPDIGGQVSGLTVTCQGAGYDAANPPQITFSGGGGTGAAATPVLLNGEVTGLTITSAGSGYTSAPAVAVEAPETSVFYRKQIDLSTAAVTTLLGGGSSASAFLQIEEKAGADSTVLAQVPVTLVARVS
jgi:hypothetical protein